MLEFSLRADVAVIKLSMESKLSESFHTCMSSRSCEGFVMAGFRSMFWLSSFEALSSSNSFGTLFRSELSKAWYMDELKAPNSIGEERMVYW